MCHLYDVLKDFRGQCDRLLRSDTELYVTIFFSFCNFLKLNLEREFLPSLVLLLYEIQNNKT